MNGAMFKSFLRHLLGAVLTAAGTVLVTPADLTVKVVVVAVGAAVIPVFVKYVEPSEDSFGRVSGPDESPA